MSTTYKRASDETWWHWMPECIYWKAMPGKSKRGKTIYISVVVSGFPTTYPGTYGICPGCLALHNRHRTRDVAIFVQRQVYIPVRSVVRPVPITQPAFPTTISFTTPVGFLQGQTSFTTSRLG